MYDYDTLGCVIRLIHATIETNLSLFSTCLQEMFSPLCVHLQLPVLTSAEHALHSPSHAVSTRRFRALIG